MEIVYIKKKKKKNFTNAYTSECMCAWGDIQPCRKTQGQTHKRQIQRDGECHKQTERQVKEDRESHRHTAGRWRSLRAPGQPCDEDSGDRNQRSPCYVRIVMRRRMGWLVKGGGG